MADFFSDILLPVLIIITPIALLMLEIIQRGRYPIYAVVKYQIGGDTGGKAGKDSRKKNLGYMDRIGLFYRKNSVGEAQPVPIWKFRSNGKMVQNMDMGLVDEITVPMVAEFLPLKKRIQIVNVDAISGKGGEEFYAMKYNLDKGEFSPIFSEDWAMTFAQIWNAIQERHATKKFWETYGVQIIIGSLIVIVAALLLFVAFKLEDVAKAIQGSNMEIARAVDIIQNRTINATNVTKPTMPTLPFLPPT